MKTSLALISLTFLLVAAPAQAGRRNAVDELTDLAADSDADCARTLRRRVEALADAVDDGSTRKVRERAKDVRTFAADQCPKKLASKVRRAVDTLLGTDDDDDDDDRRSRRRRATDRDDDDDDTRAPTPRRRDCGTGDDPGCNTGTPMDAEAFQGFVSALNANPNELLKLDLVRNTLSSQTLTARQLGPVLDAFQNELLRLDAAKAAVPRLVDPQHAVVHASKWRNSLLATDYSRLFAR